MPQESCQIALLQNSLITFTWNKILSDSRISTCQRSFKTALWLWFSIPHITFLGSNITLTFDTGTFCWLVWSEERWVGGNTCFLPQSKVNEFVDDVHWGRTGKFLDYFQPETNGIPQPWEQYVLWFFNDSSPNTPDHTNTWELQLNC
jgi:hypothetical protein